MKKFFQKRKLNYNVTEILRKHFILYGKFLRKDLKVFPGAKLLPKKLKSKGYKLGLVSGSTKEQIDIILKKLKIKDQFEVIVSTEDVQNSKPSPEGYILAAKKLGIKPKDCIVIEDATQGVKSGKNARMKVIGITNGSEQDLSLADIIFNSLDEVKF